MNNVIDFSKHKNKKRDVSGNLKKLDLGYKNLKKKTNQKEISIFQKIVNFIKDKFYANKVSYNKRNGKKAFKR